jgi:hypothetical protein
MHCHRANKKKFNKQPGDGENEYDL